MNSQSAVGGAVWGDLVGVALLVETGHVAWALKLYGHELLLVCSFCLRLTVEDESSWLPDLATMLNYYEPSKTISQNKFFINYFSYGVLPQ